MTITTPKLSALLLAGGKARRFGTDKGLAPFRGRPLAAWALAVLAEVSDDVWVSTNHEQDYQRFGYPIVQDIHAGRGPLAGLHAALGVVHHELLAVTACDMPFTSPELFRYMARLAEGFDVIVPLRAEGDFREPLHALYHRRCRPAIEAALERGESKVVGIFDTVKVCSVPEAEWRRLPALNPRVFDNINTREDLRQLGGTMENNRPKP